MGWESVDLGEDDVGPHEQSPPMGEDGATCEGGNDGEEESGLEHDTCEPLAKRRRLE